MMRGRKLDSNNKQSKYTIAFEQLYNIVIYIQNTICTYVVLCTPTVAIGSVKRSTIYHVPTSCINIA